MVTPSSILSFATCGLDVDLSFDERSMEVLKDSKDEPVAKKRVSNLIRMMVVSVRLRPWVFVPCPCQIFCLLFFHPFDRLYSSPPFFFFKMITD